MYTIVTSVVQVIAIRALLSKYKTHTEQLFVNIKLSVFHIVGPMYFYFPFYNRLVTQNIVFSLCPNAFFFQLWSYHKEAQLFSTNAFSANSVSLQVLSTFTAIYS